MHQLMTSKQVDTTLALPVMEDFYTIQGEGFHQGKAAYFIRLAGCDVGCTWCDVKESWEADAHPIVSLEDLAAKIKSVPAEIVVVTGGEPLMYDLTALTQIIHNCGKKAHVETSGAYPLSGTWDWICVSPKRFKKVLPDCLAAAHELKTVIVRENDFRFAEKHAESVSENCLLYLQPEWSVEAEVLPAIINYVKENPRYRISLQVHKYIDVP
jgi:7-carboxy-7-deazaguanine synthase